MEREKTLLPSKRHSGAHLDRPREAPVRTAVVVVGPNHGFGRTQVWLDRAHLRPVAPSLRPLSIFVSESPFEDVF